MLLAAAVFDHGSARFNGDVLAGFDGDVVTGRDALFVAAVVTRDENVRGRWCGVRRLVNRRRQLLDLRGAR
jgi:hypothetical protein